MDDIEIIDSVPANSLESGDRIVFRGEPIILLHVEDQISEIFIQWDDDGIPKDAPLDPFQLVDLWALA